MPVYKYIPGSGDSSSNEDPRLTEMMQEMPDREVFVKDTDDSMVGTGMLLLEDNTLLAPEGFATESGSINFGDLITLSEASGFLAIQNNLNSNRYRLVDHFVPKNGPSSKPGYVHMIEAENEFVSQGVSDTTLNANPLVFSYTTSLLSRVNSLKFKAASAMTNLRMKITATGPNVVVKYYPSKAAWVQGVGGDNLEAGDNVLDFKDTPLLFEPGQNLSFEIRANSVSMLGNASGVPYMTAMVQRGQFKYLANFEEIPTSLSGLANDSGYITDADVPVALSELANDIGFVTASQAASSSPVQSVNGQVGNVSITIPAAQIQSDWNQANTASLDYIKNKPTIPTLNYTVTSVNTKTGDVVLTNTDVNAAATIHTHAISDVTNLQTVLDSKANSSALANYVTTSSLSTTLSGYITNSSLTSTLGGYATTTALTSGLSGKFNVPTGNTTQYIRGDGSLATFPTIPTVNYPVTSVNSKTGAVVLSTSDVTEGTNLYYTNTRVQSYLTSQGFRKVETFLGTTNASGDLVITFANTYSTAPDVQAQIFPSTTANQIIRVTSVTTTGCTIKVEQRNAVTLLAVEVLLAAVVPVNGASVSVQVTPRS